MELWTIWLILAGILFVVEMLTLTFYLLWLGIGAIVAAVIDWFWPGSFVAQLAAGCIVVLILTVFTGSITRRIHSSRGYKDAVDDLVGKQGIVLEEAGAGAPGIVKVGNETWSAVSNTPLVKGELVQVISRGNAVLQVEKWGG
ncbi:NfeD family protein [Paenibacillus sp. LHD-38]|uniref:NfeD family protein n=1 Tax=Paenibacillus sp. LHD-38 TaxID=3072143 RepID=UPI00280F1BD8|nr:NfeD family protein [Paenibacillus sp. LHD-38]MDQ8733063.1 NfeD family protein [Paenibacillus sp. LHD-38]